MPESSVYYGQTPLSPNQSDVAGKIVEVNGEAFYQISHYDRMPPFFMTIVSDSDHWMFLSSKGGVTCGRGNADNALFPYYTDDKIHDASTTTGSFSQFHVWKEGKTFLWLPFHLNLPAPYSIARNIYKSLTGNQIIFEEINHCLGLKFRMAWMNSESFGFVRQASLTLLEKQEMTQLEVFDGIRNILPYGINSGLQTRASTLVDGYKYCEIDLESNLGIYSLSSIITDRAEPSEALKATTVWSTGFPNPLILLSDRQIEAFQTGIELKPENRVRGRRGAYFIHGSIELDPGSTKTWWIVADINQGPSNITERKAFLLSQPEPAAPLLKDVERGTQALRTLVAHADGIQDSGDSLAVARHFSNSLFNIMRGGTFPLTYQIPVRDFLDFIKTWNRNVHQRHKDFIESLGDSISLTDLRNLPPAREDAQFQRLIYEYLPLTFSRRHGDPSRPWNKFSIEIKTESGDRNFNYQGNWRDIFQNWEALALSYPEYLENFIAKFVNASTVDGYNPYRVTRHGIDWEVFDPTDPWSNIGYWGDHQIIYLLKFLEWAEKFHPGTLEELLHQRIFVYANVPYRIRPYQDILNSVQETIDFDHTAADQIEQRVEILGSDGKLVMDRSGSPYRVCLFEKLLTPLLSKISNFVPEGGIWMNTQRPEWNDANNALVGYGLSMVTLYYIRRYLSFLATLLPKSKNPAQISSEVYTFLIHLHEVFQEHQGLLTGSFSPAERKHMVDALGEAGSQYRLNLYTNGFSGKTVPVDPELVASFLDLSLQFADHTIRVNRREDGLFHAYNLIQFRDDGFGVQTLQEMLEGQVAVLSSGFLTPQDALTVLDALRQSSLYREDQNSFILYPDQDLGSFLDKNIIRADLSPYPFLLRELEAGSTRIVEKDINDRYHFNGAFRNATELREALDQIPELGDAEQESICELFEDTFNHRAFTGRSGAMFKYEGLGCVYWHMVSKLLLVTQEVYFEAAENGADSDLLPAIRSHYEDIREGIGLKKSPEQYGAFPVDPYSHTPGFTGVQQPGMTGQVKEDFISRLLELGVIIKDGQLGFHPRLLSPNELKEDGTLQFTICGIPVIYFDQPGNRLEVHYSDGSTRILENTLTLSAGISRQVFLRDANLTQVKVFTKIQ